MFKIIPKFKSGINNDEDAPKFESTAKRYIFFLSTLSY
ncbi:predicted protein [Botrytis cinerea T4]|uniref:Uncharacterized protein n=1 Tax=Botryotinia fuckeliana (strain T4) TaxID=999810 RepID=G2YWG4_BOTF4|nr:predicted protein [Botrytis cinerea T4]